MMITNIDKLTDSGCSTATKDKVCRSRGGESCAFDGAMIVLQPIADAAHIVHGPIACCGNTWEGRGTLSSVRANDYSPLHRMGFTTDMNEMDIVYGSEEKLYKAILKTYEAVKPKAIFVHATCVSGLIGENIEAVCKKAETELSIRVIPVNAPGFVGPKNLGNRIAGEVLLDYVIGTGEPPYFGNHNSSYPPHPCPLPLGEGRGEGKKGGGAMPAGRQEAGGVTLRSEAQGTINLIGEYNIAGDLWLVEPVFNAAGIRILSRITGDATFEEITYAHRAKLNVVVCSRALINVAKEMERKYGIPYVEVSFFGKTEMSTALRTIASRLSFPQAERVGNPSSERFRTSRNEKRVACECNFIDNYLSKVEQIISEEEQALAKKLKTYEHLKGKKAVLYTGGVKSWSFISALRDLGIEIVAVGTKKSTFEDEEKMKNILGENAPLVEDVTPKNLLRLLKERNADILVAGGRNQYLAVKEGYPFVDVNQERHTAYAGYEGLVNLAEEISSSIRFYNRQPEVRSQKSEVKAKSEIVINPLKHSQSIGAAIAFQGIHNAVPVIHGAQGCNFLAKVLLTKHFREPIALVSSKLFTEDIVMGSGENLVKTVEGIIEKNTPDLIGVLTSGLSEIKGDDISAAMKPFTIHNSQFTIVHVPTPDYEGGLETGYAKAVEALIEMAGDCSDSTTPFNSPLTKGETGGCVRKSGIVPGQVNVLAGSHLTPADFSELREIIESFGLRPIILPDLSALDGSRKGISPLAIGGTTVSEIHAMGSSEFTIAIGVSMGPSAKRLKEKFGIEYRVFDNIAGLSDVDIFLETLGMISGRPAPSKYERQRRILVDGLRDAHFFTSGKKACIALEPDHAVHMSRCLNEMGMDIDLAVIPSESKTAEKICARSILAGDLFSIEGAFDILVSSSHAEDAAKKLGLPLYQTGFPAYKVLGNTSKITIGYRGTLTLVNDVANLLMQPHTKEFISKAPSPSPSPSRGEGENTAPPLRGGDEGEGDVCGFTNDLISKYTEGGIL